ncbi:hypothetical protein SISSUDRAFT_441251 [Sistotremastrum suecicum HHB10207 ss-3]|uniref:Uncharacterized protein n=1 Tax=Sistotremastrum suecicum HHB10207 ss-3 TaxID=1314776 RepID=A0A166FKA9_9AGAM|nr:hypothetical protein SISSUDRAFT_441251 [Sistotremastrum suecicum HHB10207 ss-3]
MPPMNSKMARVARWVDTQAKVPQVPPSAALSHPNYTATPSDAYSFPDSNLDYSDSASSSSFDRGPGYPYAAYHRPHEGRQRPTDPMPEYHTIHYASPHSPPPSDYGSSESSIAVDRHSRYTRSIRSQSQSQSHYRPHRAASPTHSHHTLRMPRTTDYGRHVDEPRQSGHGYYPTKGNIYHTAPPPPRDHRYSHQPYTAVPVAPQPPQYQTRYQPEIHPTQLPTAHQTASPRRGRPVTPPPPSKNSYPSIITQPGGSSVPQTVYLAQPVIGDPYATPRTFPRAMHHRHSPPPAQYMIPTDDRMRVRLVFPRSLPGG